MTKTSNYQDKQNMAAAILITIRIQKYINENIQAMLNISLETLKKKLYLLYMKKAAF